VARARAIVTAFEAAQREGRAVVVVEGQFVDPPVYRRALDQLARAGIELNPGG
jgi:citrate lyase beta subunit